MKNNKVNHQLSANSIHEMWQNGYAKVPNSILERKDLGAVAKVCASWLAGRPPRWHLIISQMCAALNISERQWANAKKELIAAGFFEQKKIKKPDGKYEWNHWWLTIPTFTTDGQAANDETMNGEPTDLALIAKNKDKALHAANMQDGNAHYLSVAAKDCGIFNIPNAMAQKWQDAGIKIEQVKEACGKAQKRKGNKPIPANYLDRVVMDYADKGGAQQVTETKDVLTSKPANDTRSKPAQSFVTAAVSQIVAQQIAENSPVYNHEETLAQLRTLGIKKTISHPKG